MNRKQEPRVQSVRESPGRAREAIAYFQKCWATDTGKMLYEDCILNSLRTDAPLPQWYLLLLDEQPVGCAGLIPNDFISRMDLWPWFCALYIAREHRGNAYGSLLLERARRDARALGYPRLYLCSDLVGYYERYGFEKMATGYHPWGESTAIYWAGL